MGCMEQRSSEDSLRIAPFAANLASAGAVKPSGSLMAYTVNTVAWTD